MLSGATATIIAAIIAAAIALIGFLAPLYYRLGKMEKGLEANREASEADYARLSDKIDANREAAQADYARLSDKIDANREAAQADYARLSDKIDAGLNALRTEMVAEFQRHDARQGETLTEIRRLMDALISHSHDPDTGVVSFRIPPGTSS